MLHLHNESEHPISLCGTSYHVPHVRRWNWPSGMFLGATKNLLTDVVLVLIIYLQIFANPIDYVNIHQQHCSYKFSGMGT